MSETTKRTLGADMIDLSVPWASRIDPTHLIAKPVEQCAPRPSTFTADGGAECETTNSPAKIASACAGRKTAVGGWVDCWQFPVGMSAFIAGAISLPLTHGSVAPVLGIGLLAALSGLTVGLARRRCRRASDSGGSSK